MYANIGNHFLFRAKLCACIARAHDFVDSMNAMFRKCSHHHEQWPRPRYRAMFREYLPIAKTTVFSETLGVTINLDNELMDCLWQFFSTITALIATNRCASSYRSRFCSRSGRTCFIDILKWRFIHELPASNDISCQNR